MILIKKFIMIFIMKFIKKFIMNFIINFIMNSITTLIKNSIHLLFNFINVKFIIYCQVLFNFSINFTIIIIIWF